MTANRIIEEAWEQRGSITPANAPRALREAVEEAIAGLDSGRLRVAEKAGGEWVTHQWLKKAVLLSFRLFDMEVIPGGPNDPELGPSVWWDKVPSKFDGWKAAQFKKAGFRAVPGSVANTAPGNSFTDSVLTVGSASTNSMTVDVSTCPSTDAVNLTCIGCNAPLSAPSTGAIDQNRPRMSASA